MASPSLWNLWLAGLAAAGIVGFLSVRALRGMNRTQWLALARDEDGAAYSLSYVLTMPIYLLLVCLIIQSALAMVVKLGSKYAAFAAARSYAVWLPADSALADAKAQQAAAQAMTAFAGVHGSGGGSGYAAAYDEYASGEAHRVASSFVARKRGYAGSATQVSLDSAPSSWNGDVKVTVTYTMPFSIPVIGRLFGATRTSAGYVLPIESHATVQVEGAKDKALGTPNPLGIRYESGEL